MAEEIKNAETELETKNENPEAEVDFARQIADLNRQNQELMTQIAKLKTASDKNASEAADYKKRWRETLSAQELASQEKAEAEAKQDEELNTLRRRVAISDYKDVFLGQGYAPDMAQKAAEAFYDGDNETLFSVQKAAQDAVINAEKEKWLKSRPEINAGTGTQANITKEQFDNMSMAERTKLRRESPQVYERLVGRG